MTFFSLSIYLARSLGFSSFGESRFFGENRKNVRHNRRPDKNASSSKVKVMMDGGNRRRSVSQVVIGFSDEHRAALRDQDESFYGDIISDDDSEGSVSSSDSSERSPLPALDSDEEENLDESFSLAGANISALGAPVAAAKKTKRAPVVSTSLAAIEERRNAGCNCRSGNCFVAVTAEDLKTSRNLTEVLDKASRLIFLSGQLHTLANRGETQQHVSVAARASRSRVSYRYEVNQTKVCLSVFLYANSVTRYELQSVQSHLDAGIIVPPDHGNVGSTPWHAVSAEEVGMVRDFIQNYACVHGLPQPSAPRGHNTAAPTYLPSIATKKMVHALNAKAGGTVSYQTFDKLWLRDCSDVIIMNPKEDVCGTCSDLQSVIVRARTEDARKRSVDELTEHMRHANEARDHYRHMIAKAKDALAEVQQDDDAELRFEHYTFDFAQQATIPHHAREVGALYFKVPRRIQIFGIAAEAVPSQYNYLFDEDQAIGIDGSKSHGPNAVLSMLHHHLQHHSRAKSICLHADNCCGQNKNKSVLAYLAWRVIVGLNSEIELSFMRVGHTRCFVDGGFGLLKQRYRKSDVDTVQQLADATEESAAFNKAVQFTWQWREWDAFLAESFVPLKNVTRYQRFRFLSSELGKVRASQSTSLEDKCVTILKATADINTMSTTLPPVLKPAGMSRTRADYLFKQIRPHCHEENRDVTCPDPRTAPEE